MKNKKTLKLHIKSLFKAKKNKKPFFTLGLIDPAKGKILFLLILIIFMLSFLFVLHILDNGQEELAQPINVSQSPRQSPLEKEISQLVHGYPIETMTPYIASQDPKVAAFLISIAKKESNWGLHKPVLDGKDCYNYWGFRLKADKMGSGGHTCFNSPKEAVDAVASRLDQMVNEEKIDSPKEMVIWKCGYGCENKLKKPSEIKWISDVNSYYKQFSDYL